MEVQNTVKSKITFGQEAYKVLRIKMLSTSPEIKELYQQENQHVDMFNRNQLTAFFLSAGLYTGLVFQSVPRLAPALKNYRMLMAMAVPLLASKTVSLMFDYNAVVVNIIQECPRSVHAELFCVDLPYITDAPAGLNGACRSYYQRLAREGIDPEEVLVSGGADLPFDLQPLRTQLDHPENASDTTVGSAVDTNVDDSSSSAERLRTRSERRLRQARTRAEQEKEKEQETSMESDVVYTKADSRHEEEVFDLLPAPQELEDFGSSRNRRNSRSDDNADYFFESEDEASNQSRRNQDPSPDHEDERDERRDRRRRRRRRRPADGGRKRAAHDPNVMNLDDDQESTFQ